MDFTPNEIEQMAAGMRQGMEPPHTPEESGDALLTEVRRIVQMEGGQLDQFSSHYDADSLAISYGGRTFARYQKDPGAELWIEFEMYPALRQKYASDARFAGVPNKESDTWRVYLSRPQDIEQFRDLIADETL